MPEYEGKAAVWIKYSVIATDIDEAQEFIYDLAEEEFEPEAVIGVDKISIKEIK